MDNKNENEQVNLNDLKEQVLSPGGSGHDEADNRALFEWLASEPAFEQYLVKSMAINMRDFFFSPPIIQEQIRGKYLFSNNMLQKVRKYRNAIDKK